MKLISLYNAEAVAEGGRANGSVKSADGNISFPLRLPKELGGDEENEATNPEQLFACALAASLADAIVFTGKQRGQILKSVTVKAKVKLGQYVNDGFVISREFSVILPDLTKDEAESLVLEAQENCPIAKTFNNSSKTQIVWQNN